MSDFTSSGQQLILIDNLRRRFFYAYSANNVLMRQIKSEEKKFMERDNLMHGARTALNTVRKSAIGRNNI